MQLLTKLAQITDDRQGLNYHNFTYEEHTQKLLDGIEQSRTRLLALIQEVTLLERHVRETLSADRKEN